MIAVQSHHMAFPFEPFFRQSQARLLSANGCISVIKFQHGLFSVVFCLVMGRIAVPRFEAETIHEVALCQLRVRLDSRPELGYLLYRQRR